MPLLQGACDAPSRCFLLFLLIVYDGEYPIQPHVRYSTQSYISSLVQPFKEPLPLPSLVPLPLCFASALSQSPSSKKNAHIPRRMTVKATSYERRFRMCKKSLS